MPVLGAGTQPGQPPFGASPVAAPTPNRGNQANGLALVSKAIQLLEMALPHVGAGTDPGKAVISALRDLTKHVDAAAMPPSVGNSAIAAMMLKQRQEAPLIAALRAAAAKQMAGGPGVAGTPPPEGAPGAGGAAA